MNKLYQKQLEVKVLTELANRAAQLENDDLSLEMLVLIHKMKQEALAVIEAEQKASEHFQRMAGSPDLLT
jgi:hypothetical protein